MAPAILPGSLVRLHDNYVIFNFDTLFYRASVQDELVVVIGVDIFKQGIGVMQCILTDKGLGYITGRGINL